MLEEVKSKLLDEPELIQHILETFEFDKVRIRNNEIFFKNLKLFSITLLCMD